MNSLLILNFYGQADDIQTNLEATTYDTELSTAVQTHA